MSQSNVSIQLPVVQANGYLVSDMGGDKVMMSIEKGMYFNLGHSGGRIWELLESPRTVSEIVWQLTAEYDIAESECERQVAAFLSQLAEQGLIKNAG
ncbi:lasso peptide biosynthesis PqqD family chaperone [Paenibacillus sp. NEAU-GSW1]|uniref:lasso peptide biosynthesis PqqD family chaperone n=1 Tax=Paenibacillus sp. NEAU-GSW1 TaxID=2682486 RepID=UPI0012E31A5A|nr:lasso peptide biosynthesis PqqD family chaperone [Paenibacillus sp. NEAU-GSW1]MUT68058.1 lasso peptide biosynthesis PqqD family chaperone [Paenibacillus sp. NEAU-GSW1]